MNKQRILTILIPTLCCILAVFAYLKLALNEKDSVKFKKEYESLNGVEVSNYEYQKLDINSNNPIRYSNYDEIIDIIENKTGIIYLGFPECPWCRTALPVLFDVAKDNNIDKIYYLNIKNERDSYVLEDGKLTYSIDENGNQIKGTKGYFKLLEALDEHLSDYVINFEHKDYEVGEKRIYAPSVIFVKNGEVLGIHVSTVTSQENPFDGLTEEQYDELYSIYENYILEINNNTCSLDSSC